MGNDYIMMHNKESDGTEVVEVNFVSFQGLDVAVVSFHLMAIEHVPENNWQHAISVLIWAQQQTTQYLLHSCC